MAINYPAALLENTFTDKFFQEQVRPFQTGATNVKPSLSSTIKNWRPHKAFMPQSMGGTFYTKPTLGAARFLGGTGIGTLMGAYTGAADLLQKHLEEQGLTGEGGIYDQSGGWGAMGAGADIPIIRKMIMDKRATQKGIAQVAMQKRIQEEEKKRIQEEEKKRIEQDNWKPTYNPSSSHAEARSTGGDYHSGHQSTVGGQTTDWGSESAMIARGGLAQHAPRYANGGLIDFYRYGGFI